MYRFRFYKTDWERTLEKAARDFYYNPTKDNKEQILYILEIEEKVLWDEVRKVIRKEYQADQEYQRSGKADQKKLKQAVEQLEYINRHLKGEGKKVMGEYWQEEVKQLRMTLFRRATGVKS